MHWVIQSNMYQEKAFEDLLATLSHLGLPHSVHKVVPFVHTLEPEICTCECHSGSSVMHFEACCRREAVKVTEKHVIAMGTYTMTEIARAERWSPGSYLNENFDYRVQLRHWGSRMLNSWSVFRKLKDLRIAEVPGHKGEPFFIRPVGDSKFFAGAVMDWERFEPWRDGILALRPEDGATMNGDTEIMASAVKDIHQETRVWIVGGKVSTSSVYKIGSRVHYSPIVDPKVTDFALETAQIWSPADAYVMDVADTGDALQVIEVNNINSAGWYAANMGKLVTDLEDLNSDSV